MGIRGALDQDNEKKGFFPSGSLGFRRPRGAAWRRRGPGCGSRGARHRSVASMGLAGDAVLTVTGKRQLQGTRILRGGLWSHLFYGDSLQPTLL